MLRNNTSGVSVHVASSQRFPSMSTGFGLRRRLYFTVKYTISPVMKTRKATERTKMYRKTLSTLSAMLSGGVRKGIADSLERGVEEQHPDEDDQGRQCHEHHRLQERPFEFEVHEVVEHQPGLQRGDGQHGPHRERLVEGLGHIGQDHG